MYDKKGRYLEPDTRLLHATKENAFGPMGGRVGFAFLPWVKVTTTSPDGKVYDNESVGSMWYAIAVKDPFQYYSMPKVPVYTVRYSVTKQPRRRIVK